MSSRIQLRHGSDGHRRALPLGPLVESYLTLGDTVATATVVEEVASARGTWLEPDRLARLDEPTFAEFLHRFHRAVHPVCLLPELPATHVRFVRHALNHLLNGQDSLADRLSRCVTPGEAYATPGLGPTFWAAVVKAIDPAANPLWCPATETGLSRLGLLPRMPNNTRRRFDAVQRGYAAVRAAHPRLAGWQLDEFLVRVGRTTGRELSPQAATADDWSWSCSAESIESAVREVRVRTPLRRRIRGADAAVSAALTRFQEATRAGDPEAGYESFRAAFPAGDWEHRLPRVHDAYSVALPTADRGRLLGALVAVLLERFRAHPLEFADVILAATGPHERVVSAERGFGGFCSDTFRFLAALPAAGSKDWMASRRDRYQFVLREPLVELCEALAARYVGPVLGGEYGWAMETGAKPGRALTSICKNDFGRSGPYQPVQWITFYRRAQANKRADAQFMVRIADDGVRYGYHLGRSARDAGRQFRRNIQEYAEAIHAALAPGAVFDECRFWAGDDFATEVRVRTPADLREWATHKTIAVGKHLPPDSPILRSDDLVGEILLTFDRLVPLYVAAAEPDPAPRLHRRAGRTDGRSPYDRATFTRETYLSESWLDRALGLLRMKKQLVLQGVPGTGKTHVARCLARLLTYDRSDNCRLVQFHPAYSYEEFVEGIRVRNVEVNGRSEVTYPVENGLLAAFAEQAARHPSEPHALVIDELNRGNLPRIFGELLYLLEYRDQAVTLPYSKREFRLPDNLFVIATMNATDRSAVALDHALRRRFSFVDMPADAAVLAGWLECHQPADPDETFGPRVVRVFEELNRRLARDLGSEKQVGHSFFMVPDLDAAKLAAVWEHHVRPLLLDYFGGRTERIAGYEPGRLMGERKHRTTGQTV